MLIGYILTRSGEDAEAAAQRRALAEAGCEEVVEERSNLDHGDEQTELHDLLMRLQAGDVVVVTHLDSLGRSLPKVVQHAQQITAAGIELRSLAEALDAQHVLSLPRSPLSAGTRTIKKLAAAGVAPEAAHLSCRPTSNRRSSRPCCQDSARPPPWRNATASARPPSAVCCQPGGQVP